MSAITDGLDLAYYDALAVALADLMHQDEELRNRFGGRTLAGTVDCTPGTTTFTGTGTSWLSGDDSLAPGNVLVAGPQLVTVETISGEGTLEIEVPKAPATEPGHVAGLIDATIHKAARGIRVAFPHLPIPIAPPYWTVAVVSPPPQQVGVGHRLSSPSLQWTGVYLTGADSNILDHDQASWTAIVALAEKVVFFDQKSQTLQVPRFDTTVLVQGNPTDKSTRLVRHVQDHTPLLVDVGLPDPNSFISAPSMIFTWEGNDPGTAIPRRW